MRIAQYFLPGGIFITLFLITTLSANSSSTKSINFGLGGGYLNFLGETLSTHPGMFGEASLGLPITKNFALNLSSGFGQQSFTPLETEISTQLLTIDFCGTYSFPFSSIFSPLFYTGISAINFKRGDWPNYWDGAALAGGGIDIDLGPRVTMRIAADYRYTTGKDFDGNSSGPEDTYMTAKAGFNYYFRKSEKNKPSNDRQLLASNVFALIKKDVSKEFEQKLEKAENLSETQDSVPGVISPMEWAAEKSPDKTVYAHSYQNEKNKEMQKLLDVKKEIVEKLNSELLAREKVMSLLVKEAELPKEKKQTDPVIDIKTNYKLALQKFKENDCAGAARLFENLLAAGPSHKLASNCQYWIGECAYSKGDYKGAIAAFESTLNYPDSPKLDDAHLMLGLAYKKLLNVEKADYYFSNLIHNFANSEYVPTAEKHISTKSSETVYSDKE